MRQQIADSAFLNVGGGDAAPVGVRLLAEQAQQVEPGIGHMRGRHQFAVVDDDRRLEGDAEGMIPPARPVGDAFRVRRPMRGGIAVVRQRSEERRGGKEGVSTGRERWSPYEEKKKKIRK